MPLTDKEMEDIKKISKSGNVSFPFASILTLIFVIAKLTETVTWSWWLVFLPLMLEFGIAILIMVAAVIFVIAMENTN